MAAANNGPPDGEDPELWGQPDPPVGPPPDFDDDDDDDDDEQPEDPPVVEEVNQRNADGSLDGGVALSPGDEEGKTTMECDLILFLECTETIDMAPDHPILQPGTTVSIGLDKNTKLSAVFDRYCAFCNENCASGVITSDLEFLHCTLLNSHDTAEASALMKNDRIRVRRIRTSERQAEAERNRYQKESDREYFKRMRLLLPDMIGAKTCDVLLDCRGKLVDENGLNQEVLRTAVRGHSAILSKRCKWLGRLIQNVRDENERRSVITIPEMDGTGASGSDQESPVPADRDNVVADSASRDPAEDNDDHGIEVMPFQIKQEQENQAGRVVNNGDNGATEIENDDDDPLAPSPRRSGSPVISSASDSNSMLWVTLPNHPPEAVKLLLEYCYTNRVLSLGEDAFLESCKTKPGHASNQGPVAPYHGQSHGSRRWPQNGNPLVSFPVALAGILLAEEASMPRLSLMCEVAASQLVTRSNVVEALGMCTTQQQRTGNNLPRLREAAMEVLLHQGQRGVLDVCRMPTFQRALKERSSVVVPSLLVGTMEAVSPKAPKHEPPHLSGCKRELSDSTKFSFSMMDKEDTYRREMERKKRRVERWKDRGVAADVLDSMALDRPFTPCLAAKRSDPDPTMMSLKRMSHHLLGSSRRRGRSRGNKARKSGRNKGV